jgi:hypothetical protein
MAAFENEPNGEMIGYCRVSTQDQEVDLQRSALIRAGVKPENILVEKVSGAARRLPVRERAIKMSCRPGWTLVVWKLDRLGRSAKDVLNIAHEFEQEGAFIRTLDGVDTSNRLIGPLILGMLALVAQFERSMIAARTKAGMAERKAQGVVFGPKVKFTAALKRAILKDLKGNKLTLDQIAKKHSVSVSGINKQAELQHYRGRVLGQSLRGKHKQT